MRIFLSHSSQDNPRAHALAQWLRENGWQDVFLDRIPRQGIAAGEDWKARIHEAMEGSVAGVFLISRGWKGSTWCQAELTLAYSLNKLIFGVLVDDLPRNEIPELLKSNWQLVDLHGGRDHDLHDVTYADGTTAQATLSRSGLANLKEGLHRARIAPEHFIWPPEDEPDRAPWRGLSPMEPEDTGIFFGREAQTGRALDAIRALRDSNLPRLLAIVGASGAGKSSFLRAGLIPRLRRDDRNYLTLPPIRPEGGALDAFAKSLTEAARQQAPRALGEIRNLVHAAAEGESEALSQFLTELAQVHRLPAFDDQPPPIPTIILPIDQGEELFQSSGRAQGGPFLSLLSHLLHQDSPRFLALITIRSDSYEALQNAPQLSGLNHSTLSLPAIAKGEYSRIITGPIDKLQSAGRKLAFDPAITDTLLAEFDKGLGRDALPLLAFTLDRLYRDYSGAAKITLDDYKAMGGIAGSIDAAVERALQMAAGQQSTPNDPLALQTLLRRTMIPWFAGIDPETGTARRNVSARDQLPPETLPLVDALIDQRLLISDGNVIEPAHEALLREWHALNGWLVADREKLTTLEALRRAAADWQAKGRHKDYLAHKAGRLDEAEQLAERPDLWQQLGSDDRAYLAACRAAVTRGVVLRRTVAAAFLVVVGIGVVATGYQARVATLQANKAASANSNALSLLALSLAETNPINAIKLILAAWPREKNGSFPSSATVSTALNSALRHTRPHRIISQHDEGNFSGIHSGVFTPDGNTIVSGGWDGLRITQLRGSSAQNETAHIQDRRAGIYSIDISSDGQFFVAGGTSGRVQLFNTTDGAESARHFEYHDHGVVMGVAYCPNTGKIVSAGSDGNLMIWEATSGALLSLLPNGDQNAVRMLACSPTGEYFATVDADGVVRVRRLEDPNEEAIYLANSSRYTNTVSFSPDGSHLLTGDQDGNLRLWQTSNGHLALESFRGHSYPILATAYSNDGRLIASGDSFGTIRIWDSISGDFLIELVSDNISTPVYFVAFSPDDEYLLAGGHDRMLRLWAISDGSPYIISSDESIKVYTQYARAGAASDDLQRFISGNQDGTVSFWRRSEGGLEESGPRLHGHTGEVMSVDWTSDESRVVSGGRDGSVRLWDARRRIEVGMPMFGHDGPVLSVAFSPDGARIVSGGEDGTIRIWDALTGMSLGDPLTVSDQPIKGVIFSADGTRVYSESMNGEFRAWAGFPAPGNILQVACRYLPHINGRPDTSTEGLAAEIGIEGLTLPEDCDTYDPPLPPEFRR